MLADTDVLVVGAGFSGLGAAIRLSQEGVDDLVVLERGHDVGGTWRDNSYPGAACDVPSHLYSYSFALNPDWSRAFSPQGEIYAYIRRVRLDRIRTELLRADPAVTNVADVARHWGFAHPGRFSATYAARYGEYPSDTLRNARTS